MLIRLVILGLFWLLMAPVSLALDKAVISHQQFSHGHSNMPLRAQLDFAVGRSFFNQPWVAAPATTTARDGLGPLFNANACSACHFRNGRGMSLGEPHQGLLLRLAKPHRYYGEQLQDKSLPGLAPEVAVRLSHRLTEVALAQASNVTLRTPVYQFNAWSQSRIESPNVSARMAPSLIGLGLLQAIPRQQLLAQADPLDDDGDGISGRVNWLVDSNSNAKTIGRFGWKAARATLLQQSAAAFYHDMGLTSGLFSKTECSKLQKQCLSLALGTHSEAEAEVSDKVLTAVVFYLSNLAVPPVRNQDSAQVRLGEAVFEQIQCSACHQKHYTTGPSPYPWLAGQDISPYSDLLLHDMGEDLADQREEGQAQGQEWRTPPLWGLGLVKSVAGKENYLHDGRARTLLEAVLWHGGEAQASKRKVMALDQSHRVALLAFLKSL